MITFARPGDTPASITQRFLGNNDASFSEQIRLSNDNNLSSLVLSDNQFYAADRPLWIPDTQSPTINTTEQQRIMQHMQSLTNDDITTLRALSKRHISWDDITHSSSLIETANQATSENDDSFSWLGYAGKSFSASLEYKAKRLESFYDQIKDTSHKLADYAKAEGKTLLHESRTEFKHAYKRLQEGFTKELQQFRFEKNKLYRKYGKMAQAAREEGFDILHSHEALRMVKALKWIKRSASGLFYLEIGENIYEIEQAYEKHGHWIKMAIEDSCEVIAAIGIGIIAATVFTAGGWIAVLGIGAVEAGSNLLADYGIETLGNAIDPTT